MPRKTCAISTKLFGSVARDEASDTSDLDVIVVFRSSQLSLAKELTSPASRILRKRKALGHRQKSKKPRKHRPAHTYNVTAPDQVCAWDITWRALGLHKPSEMVNGARA